MVILLRDTKISIEVHESIHYFCGWFKISPPSFGIIPPPPSFVLSELQEYPLWAPLMTTVNKLYLRLAHTFSTRASFAAKNQPNGWGWAAFETREFRFLHTVRN